MFSNEEIIDIINVSRVNNARLGVTGLLIYHEGSIIQILEGEKEVLYTLYNKISKDTRHKAIIKVLDFSITERNFREWSMGFKQVSNENWSELKGYLNLDNVDEFQQLRDSGNAHIISMINSFANINRLKI